MAVRSIEFHDEAAAEYDAVFDSQTQSRGSAQVDIEIERALAQIVEGPKRWAPGPLKTRRYLLRRFTFVLIYREWSSDNLQLVAIAHTSRRPGYWKQRL